jgi:hypothetical protein
VAVTALVLVGLYFGLIRAQNNSVASTVAKRDAAEKQLKTIEATIKNADADAKQFAEAMKDLSAAQSDMASGDLVFWSFDTIRRFKLKYKLDIPDVSRPAISEVDLLPSFPYRQLKFTISGSGYYHELGRFLADFENAFPHGRVVNLSIDSPQDGSSEKLSFRMQIICLIKNP